MKTATHTLADVHGHAAALAALLRLLAHAHEDLRDPDAQSAVTWLLPVAARMADDISAAADPQKAEL